MGMALYEASEAARDVFEMVEMATGANVLELCSKADEDTLRQTQNAQLALYTCGVAAWRGLEAGAPGLVPRFMAGHSIGEYAALACCEIVSVGDGARLVRKRGEVMAESGRIRPGGMAAILGLERDVLQAVCESATNADGVVVIANDNCPGQMVISGDKETVAQACALALEKGPKRALPLNVSGAFHSPLMEEPAKAMREVLAETEFLSARCGVVVCNVTAKPVADVSEWPSLLEAQLRNPVRWTESVQYMVAEGSDSFVECGGGEVLSGLIRRTHKEATCLKVADEESLAQTVAALR
jgi:[acyl-carrier-protein] S-malonyltransferase